MKEIWKDISGWEGKYQVSNFGRVKSVARTITRNGNKVRVFEKILKTNLSYGYPRVSLGDNPRKAIRIHRLVAEAFIPNPNNLPDVNHIDGVRDNNRVDNLEWVTKLDNFLHSKNVLGNTFGSKPIKCVETGEVFPSIKAAARAKNLGDRDIIKAADHKFRSRTCGGYHWERI